MLKRFQACNMKKYQQLYCALLFITGCSAAPGWQYGAQSHFFEEWGANFPLCSGENQSPINIETWKAEDDESLGHVFHSFFTRVPQEMTIKNNGHSLVVSVSESDAYVIRNERVLPGTFKFAQYHFHWGRAPDVPGSEHLLNGRQYYGELHLVHYNTKYKSIGEAQSKPDGLAVLGFFLEVDGDEVNEGFQNVLDLMDSDVAYKGGVKTLRKPKTFSVDSILPRYMTAYYRYKGSLTTPPCYESVTWTVFRQPIKISVAQATAMSNSLFREEKQGPYHVETMFGNYRAPQPLNGRKVTKSYVPWYFGVEF